MLVTIWRRKVRELDTIFQCQDTFGTWISQTSRNRLWLGSQTLSESKNIRYEHKTSSVEPDAVRLGRLEVEPVRDNTTS